MQPVEAVVAADVQQFDRGLAVRFAGHLIGGRRAAFLDDPAAHGHRQVDLGPVGGDRLVVLGHLAVGEELLVGAALFRPQREHQHAGGHPVQPVQRAQVRQVEFAAQPDQRRLHDVETAGHGGQEMRLVDDEQIAVPVDDLDLERHPAFRDRIAVEEDEGIRHRTGCPRAIGTPATSTTSPAATFSLTRTWSP